MSRKDKSIQISEAEWQIMKILWSRPGITASQVVEEAAKSSQASDGTIRTYLRRLLDKGALRFEQDSFDSRIYYYYPLVSENEAMACESQSFYKRIMKGKAGVVLASLIEASELSEEEIEALESLLKRKGGK